MARGIENYPNVTTPDSDFPNGNLIDDTGADDGTPVDKEVYADTHQVLAKLLRIAGITASGLPENEYTGFQYIEAMLAIFGNDRNVVVIDGAAASTVVSGNTNDQVTILKGAAAGQVISLTKSTLPYIGKIKIANYSYSSASIQTVGGETINSAAAPFLMDSRSVIEFQFDNANNWTIIARHLIV